MHTQKIIGNPNKQDNLHKPKISTTASINRERIFHHETNTDNDLWLGQCESKNKQAAQFAPDQNSNKGIDEQGEKFHHEIKI